MVTELAAAAGAELGASAFRGAHREGPGTPLGSEAASWGPHTAASTARAPPHRPRGRPGRSGGEGAS